MKTVREAVGDYLALRRGLGFKLKKHQRFLEEFASFLEQESTSQITSRLALLWATQPKAHTAGRVGGPVKRCPWIRALLERNRRND